MKLRLALVGISATALVLAMATATLAGQHNTPPTVAPAPVAQSQVAPAITMKVEMAASLKGISIVTPAPILPRLHASDIAPLARSTTMVLPAPRNAKVTTPRLRAQLNDSNRKPLLTPGHYAASGSNGGRGFL